MLTHRLPLFILKLGSCDAFVEVTGDVIDEVVMPLPEVSAPESVSLLRALPLILRPNPKKPFFAAGGEAALPDLPSPALAIAAAA